MASSTRGGKRGKTKRVKMKPAESGWQIYMSKDYAKKFIDGDKRPSLHNSIRKAITDRMLAGELTPEESARKKVDIFSDQVTEAVDQKFAKKKYGGKVTKMREGGEVPNKYKGFSKLPERVQRKIDSGLAQKYEYGGEVCRGNGRAYQGKPKKVQVR